MTEVVSSGDAPGRAGALVLGVDGGGSKTVARLMRVGDSGVLCVLGEGIALGSNPLSVGPEASRQAIQEAVREAYRAGGGAALADSAVLAIAGCGAPDAARALQQWASEAGLARDALLVDDTRPLMASADSESPAIGLIAGTGSSVIAKPSQGEPQIVGGWGYLIDDAGSGFDLGQRGLRHAVGRIDAGGDGRDALSREALAYTGSRSPAEFKQTVYGKADPRRYIAGFAEPVLRLASRQDPTAGAIVEQGASALARLVEVAGRRMEESGDPRPLVLMSGGLLERSTLYRRLVIRRLLESGWTRESVRLAPDAVTGCGLLAAARLAGNR